MFPKQLQYFAFSLAVYGRFSYLHPHQHVVLYFLVLSILIGVWLNFIVVLISSPLVTNAVEHLFMCSFAIIICLWVKDWFKSTNMI